MIKQYDFIVIGKGLAAQCFLFELAQKNKDYKVLQIFDEENLPACTFKTTSVVCLNGVQTDVSALGDLIYESYVKTEDFFKTRRPAGVYAGSQFSLCRQDDEGREDFERRFGDVHKFSQFANMVHLKDRELWGRRWDCFLIEPRELMDWISNEISKSLNVESIKGEVVDFDYNGNVVLADETSYEGDNVIICAGAYSKNFFEEKISDDILIRSKVVPGQYLTFRNVDWGNENIVISHKHDNLIYRAYSNEVMIGGTTIKDDKDLESDELLKEQYDNYNSLLSPELVLPAFEDGEIRMGLRHKGIKRTPFWGAIDKNLWEKGRVFGLFALYKNGFTFPFFGAKQLLSEIIDS